jgi:serine protease
MRLAYKSNLLLIMGAVGVLLLSGCNSGGSGTSSNNTQLVSEGVIESNTQLVSEVVIESNGQINDKIYEWNLLGISQNEGGDNFVDAWKLLKKLGNTPGESVTVAVIDSGYTPHPNLISNLESYNETNQSGYQFISSCFVSGATDCDINNNEIIKYKSNGLDLGNWHQAGECESKPAQNSSWHGSHVTGTIIGQGQENMYGGAYGAKVVPIRVLGKCGGSRADISNAIMWAIGEDNHHPNPNPADIINMSLGSSLSNCPAVYQNAIDMANKKGVIVVVTAGNSAKDVSLHSPANCKGVINVAGLGQNNTAAIYTNYGQVTIAASGGGGVHNSKGVLSTIWNSVEGYNISDGGGYQEKSGTSMAAPGVTAAIADIISLLKAHNIKYTPEDIKGIITSCSNPNFGRYYNDSSKKILSTGRLDVESAIKCVITKYPDINKKRS